MPDNLLVTGPPRSGKTTAVERTVERLEAQGYEAGGIVSPERREAGERVGFAVRDLLTGDERTMAHVDYDSGPEVGKYHVDVEAVDALAAAALRRAAAEADYVVVDEIAPMELYCDAFVAGVRLALDDPQPLLATVHERSTQGFVGTVTARDDVAVHRVTEATRDDLPATLADQLADWLG